MYNCYMPIAAPSISTLGARMHNHYEALEFVFFSDFLERHAYMAKKNARQFEYEISNCESMNVLRN